MKKTIKTWQLVLVCILVLAVLILALQYRTVWIIWSNLTQPKIPLSQDAEWTGGSYERIAYGDHASQYIDLYVPSSEEPVPLFVLVHGGGFVSGDTQTRQAQLMYRYFRDHGFACASVNYRLAAEARFPAAIEDVRAAVRFLVGHAQDYGYRADGIAIWGESAGGYLAAYEAVTEDQVPIRALVDFYGVMDFPSMEQQFRAEKIPGWVVSMGNGWVRDACEGFASCEECWIGKTKNEWTEQIIRESSVLETVAGGVANRELKSMILHGDADITVPCPQSRELAASLEAACGKENVAFQLLHGLGHASDLFYTEEQLGDIAAFLNEALGIHPCSGADTVYTQNSFLRKYSLYG
ncbi:MAG: alpha/beta hydrolase [Clostridia bacterium]|nr:alpha/beta hydrolase [Clostridia bacterium]